MASISVDTFSVHRNEAPYIIVDHGRKRKSRRFIIYALVIQSNEIEAEKQFILDGASVRLPKKMAIAIYRAWLQHQETQRPRFK